MIILISRAHDWRCTGERYEWTDEGEGWDRLKKHGYKQRECITCGETQLAPFTSRKPCYRHGERPQSGYSGVLIEDGEYRGRFNMRGKHPVTGNPYAQWTLKP